jgi:magnesium chelatase family protein
MHLEVPRVDIEKLSGPTSGEPSADVKKRVIAARERQAKRFQGRKVKYNSEMTQKDIGELIMMKDEAEVLLKQAAKSLGLSARSYFRVIKLAQTIADLDKAEKIAEAHVAEALQYRSRG